MSDSFNQAQYRRLKTRLTTKKNKLAKAMPKDRTELVHKTRDAVISAARDIIAEVNNADAIFGRTGYPDAWADWTRAKEDAEMQIRRLGGVLVS